MKNRLWIKLVVGVTVIALAAFGMFRLHRHINRPGQADIDFDKKVWGAYREQTSPRPSTSP